MKCCPSAQLVFVISEKLNFLGSNTMDEFRRSVGINEVNFLTVVFLPVDESYKQASVSFAQQVLQNARVKVVLQSVVMPHNILRIVQQTGVTASTWCSGLLNLFVRRVVKRRTKCSYCSTNSSDLVSSFREDFSIAIGGSST